VHTISLVDKAVNQLKITIGSASADSGEKSHGFVEVSRSPAGFPVGFPVNIVNGSKEGPTLVAGSAIKGNHLIGGMAIARLFKSLDPGRLRGAFIGVPFVNTWAFEAEDRVPTLLDHRSMAGLWPGRQAGTISERIAYAYLNEVVRRSDSCFMDFYDQERGWQPTDAGLLSPPKPEGWLTSEQYDKYLEWLKVFGVRQVLRTKGFHTVIDESMHQKGVVEICIMLGGLADFRRKEQFVKQAMRGITNVMKRLGMVEGEIEKPGYKTRILDTQEVSNRLGGIWYTDKEFDQEVKEGEVVATISDPYTAEVLEEIRSPITGIITSMWCNPVVKPAERVLGVGKLVETI
jgi:predicted deacylase